MYEFSLDRLKKAFAASGLSYKSFEDCSGVSQMTIYRIFNNPNYKPTITHIIALCAALRVSPRSLFIRVK